VSGRVGLLTQARPYGLFFLGQARTTLMTAHGPGPSPTLSTASLGECRRSSGLCGAAQAGALELRPPRRARSGEGSRRSGPCSGATGWGEEQGAAVGSGEENKAVGS
jgi:hypothetical protein